MSDWTMKFSEFVSQPKIYKFLKLQGLCLPHSPSVSLYLSQYGSIWVVNVCWVNVTTDQSAVWQTMSTIEVWDWISNFISHFIMDVTIHAGVDTSRPRPNGQHFTFNIIKCVFLNENTWILINISLKFVPKGKINNILSLVQIMAWRWPGDKPLLEPMMVSLLMHIYVSLSLNEVNLIYFSKGVPAGKTGPLSYGEALLYNAAIKWPYHQFGPGWWHCVGNLGIPRLCHGGLSGR